MFADQLVVPPELYRKAYEPGSEYESYLRQDAGATTGNVRAAWAWRVFRRLGGRGAGRRLLDVGCSTGSFLTYARSIGYQVTGIDVSERAAELARANTGADVRFGQLEDAGFAPHSFDVITCWEVLEHVQDPVAFARTVRGLLRPGGLWATSTPNWNSRWERAAMDPIRRPPFHLTFWHPKSLRTLHSVGGFETLSVKEKPIAWSEEVGTKKWLYLPIAIFRSVILQQRANRLFGLGRI